MKRMLKNVVFLGAALASSLAAAEWDNCFSPIVGVDYKYSNLNGSNSDFIYGDLFPKSYSGASFYLGGRFNENFGAELGYDWLGKKSKTVNVSATSGAVGVTGAFVTNVRVSQWRLDLNGYLPVGCEGLDLIGSVGIGFANIKANTSLSASVSNRGTIVASGTIPGLIDGSTNKTILRLGAGAQYMMTCNVGIRGMYRFEGFSSVKDADGDKVLKNASSFTLGLFYKF